MLKGVLNRLLLTLLLLIVAVGSGVVCLFAGYYPLALLCLVLIFVSLWIILGLYRYNTRKITFMFNAIESGDYAFRFIENSRVPYDKLFNMALNRIRDLLSKARDEARQQEKYYELILDSVITGIVVVSEKGNVFQTNGEALRLLGMPLLTHINQLARVDESLPDILRSIQGGQSRSIALQNERGTTNLTLQASAATIRGQQMKIIAINDIDRQLDEKELESWIRLTRVLTHEIMNAITPVISLSDTLLGMHRQEDDIRSGLEVIQATSKGLVSFVESYRSFTRIPPPDLKVLSVKPLLERLQRLMAEELRARELPIDVEVTPEELMVQADENQLSQVLLNLMKNAAAAIGTRSGGWIRLRAWCDPEENVVVEVANNGEPIPREEAEQIFVPFFTTKPDGSGIGLSISRQIMRLHGGSIKLLHSNEKETVFRLVFR